MCNEKREKRKQPFNTYSKEFLTLYSLFLQPAHLAPDYPGAVDPSGLPRSWTYKQLCQNNLPVWLLHQPAAISTTADQAACDGGRIRDLYTASTQSPLSSRKYDEPAGAVTVEKSPCMLRGMDRCGPSSTPRLKVE